MAYASVAIIGRPNVGKSTLFNRLVGASLALVDGTPGVTRDRHYGEVEWRGRMFQIIDTGGVMTGTLDPLLHAIRTQTDQAMREAALILFVLDAREGLTRVDYEVAEQLQKSRKPVLLVANKVETSRQHVELDAVYRLGFGEPLCISAEHGQGIGELLDLVLEAVPQTAEPVEIERAIQVAIVGRPNVGKSSLINCVLGEHRLLVDNAPGTTRDAIDTSVRVEEHAYTFIDTAGMRKLRHVHESLEQAAVTTSQKRIQRCDVAVLVLDAVAGVGSQDTRIAAYITEQGKACVLALNKWDALSKTSQTYQTCVDTIHEAMPFLAHAPILSVSALTGQRVPKLFPLIQTVFHEARRRITTARLQEFLQTVTTHHPAPLHRGKVVKFSFLVQTPALPPTFCCFVNRPEGVAQFYRRYFEHQLREHFGFAGVPIRVHFRQK